MRIPKLKSKFIEYDLNLTSLAYIAYNVILMTKPWGKDWLLYTTNIIIIIIVVVAFISVVETVLWSDFEYGFKDETVLKSWFHRYVTLGT